jgi:phosphoribosylglycinamide formyltransferase-1
MKNNKKRVAVLISGNGSNLQALMDAAIADDYPAHIVLVISNNPEAYGLTRAKNAGIEAMVIDHKNFKSREEFDRNIDNVLRKHNIEIVCLAGFMRILSAWFVGQWRGRMLNIHPSLLPDFKGAHAVRDALAAGVRETGCTVHLVTEEMDAGEIMGQTRVKVLEDDDEESLKQRIHAAEHLLYPQALKHLISKK